MMGFARCFYRSFGCDRNDPRCCKDPNKPLNRRLQLAIPSSPPDPLSPKRPKRGEGENKVSAT